MKVVFVDNPWKHFEVTDFLDKNVFTQLQGQTQYLIDPLTVGERVQDKLADIHPETLESPPLRKAYNIIKKQFCELCSIIGVPYNSRRHWVMMEFDRISPNFTYPVHPDSKRKIVSFIFHISDEGVGTRLHESPFMDYCHTTKWTPNGGSGFVVGKDTWHSFDTIGLQKVRKTIGITLRSLEDTSM